MRYYITLMCFNIMLLMFNILTYNNNTINNIAVAWTFSSTIFCIIFAFIEFKKKSNEDEVCQDP